MFKREKWSIKCKCVLFAYYFSWERGKNDAIFAIKKYKRLNFLIMRAKRNISAIVIAIMCVLSITAQKIIPVDSTHLLSIEQKQTIEFIKKHIDKNNSELELPLEVNYLLGDTKAKDHYKMKPIWKESYFLSSDSVELIVPLQNGSIDILQCQLRVDKVDNNSYYQ